MCRKISVEDRDMSSLTPLLPGTLHQASEIIRHWRHDPGTFAYKKKILLSQWQIKQQTPS